MKELTPSEVTNHFISRTCHIYKKAFSEGEKRVKDQGHVTGQYSGPAQNSCNLKNNLAKCFETYMHNYLKADVLLLTEVIWIDGFWVRGAQACTCQRLWRC